MIAFCLLLILASETQLCDHNRKFKPHHHHHGPFGNPHDGPIYPKDKCPFKKLHEDADEMIRNAI